MDNEYINKGKLIEEIRKAASRSMVGEIDEPYLDWKTVVSFIFDAPAEAVALTKYGKWNFTEPDSHGNKKPYCSNCGEYHLSSWSDYTGCIYCPNCGAKMIENCGEG